VSRGSHTGSGGLVRETGSRYPIRPGCAAQNRPPSAWTRAGIWLRSHGQRQRTKNEGSPKHRIWRAISGGLSTSVQILSS